MMNEIRIDGLISPEALDLEDVDSIEIDGFQNEEFQNEQIETYVKEMKGKKRIKTLTLTSCKLKNLEVLQYFPNLEELFIRSDSISSFQGLRHFKKGKFLLVNTEKNRKRSLEELTYQMWLILK